MSAEKNARISFAIAPKRGDAMTSSAARTRNVDVDDLQDAARGRRHDDHAVGQQHRLLDRVGDQHDGLAVALPDPHQLDIHVVARHRIERAERLVQQQDRRVEHERAADRGAPLHAAGELPGIVMREGREAAHLEQVERALAVLLARQAHDLDRHHHVLQHRAPIEQQRALEDDADVDARLRHLLAGDRDRARRWPERGPRRCFRNVLLPQPDGPTMLRNSPSRIDRLMSASASTERFFAAR